MTELLEQAALILDEFGLGHRMTDIESEGGAVEMRALAFENATVLGFALAYETVDELIRRWKADGDRVAMKHRKSLFAARDKAWNVYLILLAQERASFGQALALGLIEEDLEAMRKITKAGINTTEDVRTALLPLLPFRAAPVLDPIDMRVEIETRASDVDPQVLTAFLSSADEAVVMQLLEDRT
jgi:hypothetical protein